MFAVFYFVFASPVSHLSHVDESVCNVMHLDVQCSVDVLFIGWSTRRRTKRKAYWCVKIDVNWPEEVELLVWWAKECNGVVYTNVVHSLTHTHTNTQAYTNGRILCKFVQHRSFQDVSGFIVCRCNCLRRAASKICFMLFIAIFFYTFGNDLHNNRCNSWTALNIFITPLISQSSFSVLISTILWLSFVPQATTVHVEEVIWPVYLLGHRTAIRRRQPRPHGQSDTMMFLPLSVCVWSTTQPPQQVAVVLNRWHHRV
jgi:hypothetical protein